MDINNISPDNLKDLQEKGLDIKRIKPRTGLTLAEEAEQVDAEIQQETVSSVTSFQKILRVAGVSLLSYLILTGAFTLLFIVNPLPTSDFFGYYYRFNVKEGGNVLAAATGPNDIAYSTSVLADIMKPAASASLVAVKAIDDQKYIQIVTNPNEISQTIVPGPPGINGKDGIDGQQGLTGLTGATGATGPTGSAGTTAADNIDISNLTVSNFISPNISQWTNNSDYITASTSDVLTNKTISAALNTISGLTNSNLSGTAGITNANLANSSLSLTGNSGSGSVSLGGTLSLSGAGITSISAAGSALTVTSTEADTLQSVFNRGNTIPTTTGVTANSIDQATLFVGNIASTAQQNFSTLNITNGGTGFLDLELIRGFINFQGMNTLYDDFTNRTLDTGNKWTSTPVGSGTSCAILAGSLNGLFRMHTGAGINRGCELTTQVIGSLTDGYYQRNNNPIFETKVKVDTVANSRIFAGFTEQQIVAASETNPNTNHAYIAKKAADTTWQCVTDDGGSTETITDTGVTITADTFYRLRVELRSGTTPETICTVDNGTTVTKTVVTATQPGALNSMDVYLKLNQSDTVSKNMDVDYVRAWQDDPNGDDLASSASPSPKISATPTPTSTFISDIKTENPMDPIEQISKKLIDSEQFLTDFISARITAIRGYFYEIFTKKIHADELCAKKSDGSEVCINGDEINNLLPSPTSIPILTTAPTQSPSFNQIDSPTPTPSETSTPNPSE